MSTFFAELKLAELLTSGAVLAVIFKIVWQSTSWFIAKIRILLSTKTKAVDIVLGPCDERFELIRKHAKFNCLLIRYGTDQYVKDMANDEEKYDGRLRNKVTKLSIASDPNHAILKLRFSMHNRIGSQFKCFAQVDDASELENVRSILDAWGQIELDDISEVSSQYSNRLFFLVKSFGKTKSVEGFVNNMSLPV